ncbi:hypothetical protein DMENIID0001_078610 [Sergentomyia squamirostris]
MDSRIDSLKWKPRRTRGTPAYRYRNYFALGVIAVGVISGWYAIFASRYKNFFEKKLQAKYLDTDFDIDQKNLMSMLPMRTAEQIKVHLDDEKKTMSER